jgi:uncharacterized membrane protein
MIIASFPIEGESFMNQFNEIIIINNKSSGFNTAKIYSDLLVNTTYYGWQSAEGALFSTNKILIEYLYTLEGSDLSIPNYDIYISSSIKIGKTDLLPLFVKSNFKKKNADTKIFQFIYLTLKIILELFFKLTEKISSFSDSYSYKSIIEKERKYIEHSFKLIIDILQMTLKNTVEADSFQSSYESLIFCLDDTFGKSLASKKINLTIEKIRIRNNELYSLLMKLVEKSNLKGRTK